MEVRTRVRWGGCIHAKTGQVGPSKYLLVMTPTTPSTRDVKCVDGGVSAKEEQLLLLLLLLL